MEFKGTKKQWNVVKDKTALINVGNIIYRPEIKLDDFDSWEDYHDVTEIESIYNALLISKSPEMLEMLQWFVENFEGVFHEGTETDNKVKESKQLIKQATEL